MPGPHRTRDCSPPCIARRVSPDSVATGLASRSQYAWLGGGYTRFAQSSHDQRPDTISWSAVYGYRPAELRRGYDQWDYRGFAELTGEHTGNVRTSGNVLAAAAPQASGSGRRFWQSSRTSLSPAACKRRYFVMLFETLYGREQLRFAINFSYLKYSVQTSGH